MLFSPLLVFASISAVAWSYHQQRIIQIPSRVSVLVQYILTKALDLYAVVQYHKAKSVCLCAVVQYHRTKSVCLYAVVQYHKAKSVCLYAVVQYHKTKSVCLCAVVQYHKTKSAFCRCRRSPSHANQPPNQTAAAQKCMDYPLLNSFILIILLRRLSIICNFNLGICFTRFSAIMR